MARDENDKLALLDVIDKRAIMATTDRVGSVLWINENFCKVSGYSAEELIGQNHHILNSGAHPPGFFQDLWATISARGVWRGVICNKKKNGEFYWVDSSISPVKREGSHSIEGYLVVCFEVTGTVKSAVAAGLF